MKSRSNENNVRWKRYLKEGIIGLLVIFIFSNIISYIRAPEPDSKQFALKRLPLIDGSTYRYLEGKPVALHFWGTWCPVCRTEAPNIERLSKSYEVLTVAVNSGDDAKIAAYMQQHGLHYRVYNDKNGVLAKRFKVTAFPTTFFYDAKGVLKMTDVGYTTTPGLLARMKLLE